MNHQPAIQRRKKYPRGYRYRTVPPVNHRYREPAGALMNKGPGVHIETPGSKGAGPRRARPASTQRVEREAQPSEVR